MKNLVFVLFISSTVLAEDDAMNILYASDEGYAIPTCVSIASILANCPSENKLNIIVVDTGMSEKSRKAIENLKKMRDFKLEFRTFDMERLKIFDVGEWSPSIRIKLYINEFFPNAEKAMWVNGNIIFRKNIKQLYDVDLTGKYFAALSSQKTCCDSIVLFNIKYMEQSDVFNALINYILMNQKTLLAQTGEYALKYLSGGKFAKYLRKEHIFFSKDIDYCDNCKCNTHIACYFSNRCGYAPWLVPRSVYSSDALYLYDEWHKYCDMTDYVNLKERLESEYTITDVYMYYKARASRLWNIGYRKVYIKYRNVCKMYFLKCELIVFHMLLKLVNFICIGNKKV